MTATYAEVSRDIVAKFKVGAAFGSSVVFNPKGAAAVGGMMETMAKKLDQAVVLLQQSTETQQMLEDVLTKLAQTFAKYEDREDEVGQVIREMRDALMDDLLRSNLVRAFMEKKDA